MPDESALTPEPQSQPQPERPARAAKARAKTAEPNPAAAAPAEDRKHLPAEEIDRDGILSPRERYERKRALPADPLPEGEGISTETKRTYVYGEDPSPDEAPEASDDDTAGDDETQEHDDADTPAEDSLERRASKYGLDPADFKTPKALEKLLDRMDYSAGVMQQMSRPAATNGREQKDDEAPAPQLPRYQLQLDPEVYDKGLIAQLEGMNDHYAKQTAELRNSIIGVAQHTQQREAAAFEERFDGWVGSLGEEWKDTFGSGKGRSMDRRTKQYENRVEVLRCMDAISRRYVDSGEQLPPEEKIRERALRMAFGDQVENINKLKLANGVKKRSGMIVNRPTSRQSSERQLPEGEERAVTNARKFLARKGFA